MSFIPGPSPLLGVSIVGRGSGVAGRGSQGVLRTVQVLSGGDGASGWCQVQVATTMGAVSAVASGRKGVQRGARRKRCIDCGGRDARMLLHQASVDLC